MNWLVYLIQGLAVVLGLGMTLAWIGLGLLFAAMICYVVWYVAGIWPFLVIGVLSVIVALAIKVQDEQ